MSTKQQSVCYSLNSFRIERMSIWRHNKNEWKYWTNKDRKRNEIFAYQEQKNQQKFPVNALLWIANMDLVENSIYLVQCVHNPTSWKISTFINNKKTTLIVLKLWFTEDNRRYVAVELGLLKSVVHEMAYELVKYWKVSSRLGPVFWCYIFRRDYFCVRTSRKIIHHFRWHLRRKVAY